MKIFKRVLIVFSVVIFSLSIFAFVLCGLHSDKLDITTYTYSSNKVRKDFTSLVISDYHHRELNFSNVNMIDAIKRENKVDAIFFLGDLIDTHTKNLNDVTEIFKASKEVSNNLYFVTGNHEEYAPLYNDLESLLGVYNINKIDNKFDDINLSDFNIKIFGLEDPRFSLHGDTTFKKRDEVYKEKMNAYKSEISNDTCNILLTHRPEHFLTYASYNFDMVLAGHSHGGQVNLFNFVPSLKDDYGNLYSFGEYKKDNSTMYVSKGLGYSAMLPIRVNCNPEILKINITTIK